MTVLSISYAIFLVVFGAIVFIGDAVVSQYPMPQVKILKENLIFYALLKLPLFIQF